jgi:hypothetical protein
MPSAADVLRRALDRLVDEADSLTYALAEDAGHWTRQELRDRLRATLQKQAGKEPTEKEIDDEVAKVVQPFKANYETWYSESLAVIRQLMPERVRDFELLYRDERRKSLNYGTYTLSDYLIGLMPGMANFEIDSAAFTKFMQQARILKSAQRTFESQLYNIRGVLQADLLDTELDAARELRKNGYLRAAGMVAGVVLEAHLAAVAGSRGVPIRKKTPTISTYNDGLKEAGLLDVPQWRFIQRLADLRNLCGHPKERDPTTEEVLELIDGADKVAKTVA